MIGRLTVSHCYSSSPVTKTGLCDRLLVREQSLFRTILWGRLGGFCTIGDPSASPRPPAGGVGPTPRRPVASTILRRTKSVLRAQKKGADLTPAPYYCNYSVDLGTGLILRSRSPSQ